MSLVEMAINFLGLVSGALSCTIPPLYPGTEHAPEDATSSFAREPERNASACPNVNIFRSDDGIHGRAAPAYRRMRSRGNPGYIFLLFCGVEDQHANGVVILAVALAILGVGKVLSRNVDVLEDATVASAPRLVVFALRPASRVSPAVVNKSQLCDLGTKSPRFACILNPASDSPSSMPSLAPGLADSRPEGSAPIAVPRLPRDRDVAPGMIQDQWKPRYISTCDGLFRVSM
ncbi:hypothetical protein CDEST_03272 [Colletotrichum destructivum]|uniref:Uncharacterized protein n=1 Tax=Colletotrichum destructivum TaxID=34406 RepID=A0AAX4I4E7_9PEZI|nr:hypothetical protein CDEST_03272 [Colletotrichum destructivum]